MPPARKDFAALLLNARDESGLSQSQLANAAGLTPSYLSFIENRKKPPPSDDVCVKLASALGIPARQLLEVAHLERAPQPLRHRVDALDRSLKRERRTVAKLLEGLLSPFLFGAPSGFTETAVDRLSLSPRRRRRMREVLRAIGRQNQDQEPTVSKLVDKLPEQERTELLQALPDLLRRARQPDSAELPLCYAPPPHESQPKNAYLLQAENDALDGEIRQGDRLLVDPLLDARVGDLAILRSESGFRLARIEGEPDRLAIAGHDPVPDWSDWWAARGAGIVVEVRRVLR
ncbi:MAG: XRE family transcriptional regulator [Planctomycetota bacterium]